MSSWSRLSFCGSKPWLYLRFCTANCHPARVLLAGFRSAPLRSKLESKDRVAGLKHHGSEGRIRPRPVSQTAKRHFLNRLETSSKPWLFLRFCTANCHPARCPPGAGGFRSAPLRCKLESKDRVAGLKHPWQWRTDWARGPYPRTAKRHFLNRLETSSKPWLFLRFCTANCHPARVLLEPAFVLHRFGPSWSPRTVSQG